MKYIKGPDFPTGGIIYGIKGIETSFENGQGRINLCSKYIIEKENKNEVIRILEIPFGVIKSKLVRDIDELRVNGQINGIKDVRDESDRDGISIAIILEENTNSQTIVNFLMQKTPTSAAASILNLFKASLASGTVFFAIVHTPLFILIIL